MQHHFCPKQFPPISKASAEDYKGNIIIIGAGASGLFAALSLQRMGVETFTVLEASSNFGGRMKAATFSEDGLAFDVGAEWIHSTNGELVLRSMMKGLIDDDNEVVESVELIPYQPAWFFKSRKSKLMNKLYSETKFKSNTWQGWIGENVYEKVKSKCEFNMPVSDIIYETHAHVVKVVLANGEVREAHRVICTVPLGVLKESIGGEESLRFDPPLPRSMQHAIRSIDMPPGLKVFFPMKEKFYPDLTSADSMLKLLLDPNDVTFIYDAALGKGSDENVLAFIAVGNRHTEKYVGLSDAEVAAEALRIIDNLFDGKGSANIAGEPVVQNWAAEPFIRGAYSFAGSAKHRQELRKSVGEGRVIFAGEHTSQKHYSLVPGAAFEGRRAALEAVGLQ